jgi:hypothetical protein
LAATAEVLENATAGGPVPTTTAGVSSANFTKFPEISEAVTTIQSENTLLDKVPQNAATSTAYSPELTTLAQSKGIEGKGTRAILTSLDTATQNLAGNVQRLIDAAHVGTSKVGIYAKECSSDVATIVNAAVSSQVPMKAQATHTLDERAHYIIDYCSQIIAAPGNAAVVGPCTLEIGKYSKDPCCKRKRRCSTTCFQQRKVPSLFCRIYLIFRQGAYAESAKVFAQGVPKLVTAVKSKAKPELIQKTAEFLLKTVYSMEASRIGVPSSDLSQGPDYPLSPELSDKLVRAARAVSVSATSFLNAAGSLASNPNNMTLSRVVTERSNDFANAIGSVLELSRQMDSSKQVWNF